MIKSIKVNHSALYFAGLFLMIISIPLSRFTLSVAQFILLGNWLLEANFKNKFKILINNKPALVLVSLFLLHVIGLLYTTDFEYAFKDLRIKLPLLALPIIFVTTKPLDNKKFDTLLLFFIAASLVASFISFGILLLKEISDIRDISPFISHIRLSLNICLAIFFSGFFVFTKYKNNLFIKLALILVMIWLTVFLFISESGTGIYVLLFTSVFLVFYGVVKIKNRYHKIVILILAITIPAAIFIYLKHTIDSYLIPNENELNNLEKYTARGNYYKHDTVKLLIENGHYTGLYICNKELREEWNGRSNFDFDGVDEKEQQLKSTLYRYMTSKGLRKDAEGVQQLDDRDIRNVELGIANYHYSKKIGLNSRIYKILWEYQSFKFDKNPGGHSLLQRFEFWKASIGIIKSHFWLGVGTGDMNEAFQNQYKKMNTNLKPEFWIRAHNQFFAIFIAFGIFGFLWFIFTLVYPSMKMKLFFDYRYFVFFVIIILSMLVEDTLETQMGVTLYAFFNAFLLFGRKINS